ncbi:hypothetical protein AB0L13_12145 [Saccharopolyspora shandongensis]|uniref:hypothetical protein n=1 Tax=Saccharopolyspora shandongensis TaxID=418495 RepID=UPI0034163BCD
MSGEIEYGPVVVNRPGADLRIGYYDDDDHDLERDCPQAIVYYCEPPFTAASGYHFADLSWLALVDTDSLWNRRLKLQRILADRNIAAFEGRKPSYSYKRLYEFSIELSFVNAVASSSPTRPRIARSPPGSPSTWRTRDMSRGWTSAAASA